MENKTCTKCSQTKPLNKFMRSNSHKNGYRQPCQECNSKRAAAWQKQEYAKSPDYRLKRRENSVKQAKKVRPLILLAYGNKCACCGETEPKFLGIDHINNDGAEHRRTINKKGTGFYVWLKRNNFPKENFQLLCHNCNFAKGKYGECPHKIQQ